MKSIFHHESRNPFLRLRSAMVAFSTITAAFAAPVTFSTYTTTGSADTSWVLTDPTAASMDFGGADTSFGGVAWEGHFTNGHNSSETYVSIGGYAAFFSVPNVTWGYTEQNKYPTDPSLTVLHGAVLQSNAAQIDIGGLTLGREYTAKLIFADGNSDGRQINVSAMGANSGSTGNVQFGYADGRYLVVTATWTADATGMTFLPLVSGANNQINAIQILAGALPPGVDLTWDNGAGTSVWNTADPNWTGPAWNNNAINNAIFGATGAGAITVAAPMIVGNMTFNAPGYTISGSSLGLESSIITNDDPATIASSITGNSLTKDGTGTLTLSGGVSISATATVSGGSLVFASGGGLGTLSLDSGTSVTLAANDNSVSVSGNLILNNGATLAATGTPNANYGNIWLPSGGQQVIATGDATSTISSQLNMRDLHTFDIADGASATDLFISGVLTHIPGLFWGGLVKSGDGTLELSNSNAQGGNYLNAGTLVFASGSLGNPGGPYPFLQFSGNSTLRWAPGNTQDVSAGGELIIADGVTATLDTNGNDVTLATAIGVGGSASGSLVKSGVGTLTLTAANTYAGGTTVSGGTLSLANANLADGSTVTVENAAVLNLTHGTTDIVGTLVLGGTLYTSGTFSAATHSPFISGSGVIQVGADPFATWMSTNYPLIVSPDNQPGADPENDGIKNLLEYILQGGDPSVSTTGTLPTLDASGENFVFTYYRRADATGTTQTFEYGDNLSGWTPVAIPDGSGVVVTPDNPVAGIEKVEITVAKGLNTKLFGRLKATQP